MENLPDQAALRLELLNFRKALAMLQRKREELEVYRLELETLEEVANREAIGLLERIDEMGLLECSIILSPHVSCIGFPMQDPSEAREYIEFKEWGVLPGWDDEIHTISESDATIPFLQPVQ